MPPLYYPSEKFYQSKDEMIDLYLGDCKKVLSVFPSEEFHSIVTDPPYGLKFMGKSWDHGIPGIPYWKECYRVLKPGGYLLAFGGTRTFHRLACAIEDAGFEIRDTFMWIYGSGLPKGMDISKAIDEMKGAEREVIGSKIGLPGYSLAQGKGRRTMNSANDGSLNNSESECSITAPSSPEAKQWDGWGTALKPAWEPIIMARKPVNGTVAKNILKHGTGGINVDACRVPTNGEDLGDPTRFDGLKQRSRGGWVRPHHSLPIVDQRQHQAMERTNTKGRWPANIVHDGSEEVLEEFDRFGDKGTHATGINGTTKKGTKGIYGMFNGGEKKVRETDLGSISRFFYAAKASASERGRYNNHPTVKPIALMRWLVKLVTVKGGKVLDPFCGSGSTLLAARKQGCLSVGIDKDEASLDITSDRIRIDKVRLSKRS